MLVVSAMTFLTVSVIIRQLWAGFRRVSTRIMASPLRGKKYKKYCILCSSVKPRSKVDSAPEIHTYCHSYKSIFVGESLADTIKIYIAYTEHRKSHGSIILHGASYSAYTVL